MGEKFLHTPKHGTSVEETNKIGILVEDNVDTYDSIVGP